MKQFFLSFGGCFFALIVFTFVAVLAKEAMDKIMRKATDGMQENVAAQMARFIAEIEDPAHRAEALAELKTAIESKNIAAFQSTSMKIFARLNLQKEAKAKAQAKNVAPIAPNP